MEALPSGAQKRCRSTQSFHRYVHIYSVKVFLRARPLFVFIHRVFQKQQKLQSENMNSLMNFLFYDEIQTLGEGGLICWNQFFSRLYRLRTSASKSQVILWEKSVQKKKQLDVRSEWTRCYYVTNFSLGVDFQSRKVVRHKLN